MAKGHKLKTLKGIKTRPTADRIKESVFNIINNLIPNKNILDLYAGTGNLGIEALSRGAAFCTFVDNSKECAAIINENLVHTKMVDTAKVVTKDVNQALKDSISLNNNIFDIIFIDPPYGKTLIPEALELICKKKFLKNDGIIVTEHEKCDKIFDTIFDLRVVRSEKYGDTVVSIYKYYTKTPRATRRRNPPARPRLLRRRPAGHYRP